MTTATVPTTHEELQDYLSDRDNVKALISENKLTEFVQNYANAALSNKNGDFIANQVREQTEKVLIDFMQTHEVDIKNHDKMRLAVGDPMSRGRVPKNTLYNKLAIGAKHDGSFEEPSQFLHAISEHSHKDLELSRKLLGLRNDLSSVKPSDGGFLIPERLRAELLRVALERAIVRSRARVIPMDSLMVPFPCIDSTSNVSSVYGGFVGYWTEEGATLTESQPRFGRVELQAHKLSLYTEIPNELMQDSIIALAAFVDQVMPEALAWFEDVAFFVGGGVGEPLGFYNADAMVSVTRTTANLVKWSDIVNMFARMLPQSLDRAVWIISPEVFPQLAQMTVNVQNVAGTENVGGGPALLNYGNGNQAIPMTLLGRPIIISEKAKQLGTAGDVAFVDFSYYLIGDRQAMSARQSEDYRFQNDITAFRITERVDGRPWLLDPITPYNGGDTLSAFVQLAA